MKRQNISSGSPWEETVGYSRAVKVASHIFVAGTTATNESGQVVCVGDGYGQAKFVLEKISDALLEAGGNLRDVVRTRMFVTDINLWEDFGRAHGEFFRDIRPASTMVEVSKLIHPDHLIEIEVDAIVENETA